MKRTILTCAAAALVALPAHSQEKQSTSTVITTAGAEATVTIDVNGKKETKTFKIGDDLRKDDVAKAPAKKVTYLGVAPSEVSAELRAHLPLKEGEGISVSHVAEGGPAAKAGVQEHDILLRLDDQILVAPPQLKSLVNMKKPGDSVTLTVLRKGEQKEVKVTLSETEERSKEPGFDFSDPSIKGLRKQIEQMRDKMPEGVFNRKGIVIGPNGKTHTFDGGDLKDIVEATRKQLENSGLSKDQIESIVKSIGGAVKDVAKDSALKDLSELFGKPKEGELEKK